MPKPRALSRNDLRILYLAGPGDAVEVLRTYAQNRPFDSVAHIAYSQQFFEACDEFGAEVLTVALNPRIDDFKTGKLRAVNVDHPLRDKGGLRYHLGHLALTKLLAEHARELRANVFVTATEPYPFLLEPFALTGMHIVPALHALLLPAHRAPTLAQKAAAQLSRHMFQSCSAILSHPGAAVRQVAELTNGAHGPVVEFIPLYPRSMFAEVSPPDPDAPQFRVMTVGRVEENKGVFDLIEVAKRIREAKGNAVRFDVCGTGGALEEARSRVTALGLSETFTLHGWTQMDDLERLWGQSHLAVVPTTSRFVEGFNQVIVEAVLAGRPVVTSIACPALDFVRPCAIEVGVDDVDGYTRAVLSLADSRQRYRELQSRCKGVAEPFFDPAKSFGAAVRHVLTGLTSGGRVSPVAHPPPTV